MATAASAVPDEPSESLFSKFSKPFSSAFAAAYKRLMGTYMSQIRCGKTAFDMPSHLLAPLQTTVTASCTGPYGGICQLEADKDAPTHPPGERIAGVVGWQRPHSTADGESITLYEHKDQTTHHHGDPIADVYAILARPNSCVLAVADGCGWGIKPRLAARCAVHGSIKHLNEKLFQTVPSSSEHRTTQDVFHVMYRSLDTAQKCIIEHGGTTTTLCLATVVELAAETRGAGTNRWGVCVVSVGDSVCYVWRHDAQEVFEVTAAIREGKERNQMDAGGCLGADMGDHPDLTNLRCCFAPLAGQDLVFLASDGISDNFDPVTLRDALSESSNSLTTSSTIPPPMTHENTSSLPVLSPSKRHSAAMMRMSTLLKEVWAAKRHMLSATDVKDAVTTFVMDTTEEKRRFLEQIWSVANHNTLTPAERREQDKKISHTVKQLPGKLDHATIAIYKVGGVVTEAPDSGGSQATRRPHSTTQSYCIVEGNDGNSRTWQLYDYHVGEASHQMSKDPRNQT